MRRCGRSLQATPLPELLRELAERDPATYERIDRQNPRRVIRALEVIRLTGKPFSAQRAELASRTTHHASRPLSCLRLRPLPGRSPPAYQRPG